MKVLALSSSRVANGGMLENALAIIDQFVAMPDANIAFVPFASVQRSYEEYGDLVKQALASLSYNIKTVVPSNARLTIEAADVIMIGGGNTFKLIHDIYDLALFELIQTRVRNGTPYIGWSAGANLCGKTISTTNDMPIIQPRSFKAFSFLPFQINPHYINQTLEGHNGETRDQRLEEFLVLNPGVPVVGLPEGTAFLLNDEELQFIGDKEGVCFGVSSSLLQCKAMIKPSESLSYLL
jgi:dipeptidase E